MTRTGIIVYVHAVTMAEEEKEKEDIQTSDKSRGEK